MNLDTLAIEKLSPMMQQWATCKQRAGDTLLLFRMGDFYEAFYEDAVLLAKELELTLTKRQEIPMSGVPWHSSEAYIDKLIGKGYRVAIAEQTEDPKMAKGLVKREVVRVLTPGTLMTSSLLSEKTNNFFASITRVGSLFGLAFLDVTTAEFKVMELQTEQEILNEIYRLQAAEVLFPWKLQEKHPQLLAEIGRNHKTILTPHDDWAFDHKVCHDFLVSHFKVHDLDGFGLRGMVASINAAGALLSHLKDNLCVNIDHIRSLSLHTATHYLSIDRTSQRNLELTESLQSHNKTCTLLHILDDTQTPMGARLIRRWIQQPLLSPENIASRQEAIAALKERPALLDNLRQGLNTVSDLERLTMRILSGCATPKDLASLKLSLKPIAELKALLQHFSSSLLSDERQKLHPLPEVIDVLERALTDNPPFRISEGGIFRTGYHSPLDELRSISIDSKSWIARYQTDLRQSTGIKTLKVGFTRVFGYYIEVSKGQTDKTPDAFIRQQTLTNAERYTTSELKKYENQVLHAEEKALALEAELFTTLRTDLSQFSEQILCNAQTIAIIDCLASLAAVANKNHYSRPLVDQSQILRIEAGRHPVIEALNAREVFVPNDLQMDADRERLVLITGPNMAGKSTYIRQTALLVIMAQIGSFIPAKSAHIGIVDKVFTRIGASDDLSRGQSTFMVEMTEAASILHHATDRSLVILDEIGRGTSTYDGISIAWAIAEYLLLTEGKMAKTLFATHYWELTKLEENIPGAVNYTVAVHENQDEIRFLRKIIRGQSDKSYGIHVGRLAGLPSMVLSRAKEILVHLEENANRKTAFAPSKPKRQPKPKPITTQEIQLSFFE